MKLDDNQDFIVSRMLVHQFVKCVTCMAVAFVLAISVAAGAHIYSSWKYGELIQSIIDAGIDVTRTTVLQQKTDGDESPAVMSNISIGK